MPAAKPEEFRRRAVELARSGETPVAEIAGDLRTSVSGLRRGMAQSEIEEGHAEGLARDERAELFRLRRDGRAQAVEVEILKRASAYFAGENVLPKWVPVSPRAQP